MHEFFEHTADVGLRIRAADLATLFAEAGEALFAGILDNPAAVEHREEVKIHIDGTEREYLLFDWLNELLYRFDTGHYVFNKFEVHLTSTGLDGIAWGEPLDRQRHALGHEVKAITYHGLKVEQEADGWLAEVILDI